MASNKEYTPLIEQTDPEPIYGNIDDIVPRNRRHSVTSQNPDLSVTLDELLYRIQHAFLDNEYDVESDVNQLIQNCSETEIDRFLQCLNTAPLHIQQKLNIAKILHTEGNLKHRYTHGKNQRVYKKTEPDKVLTSYHLWEGTITKIAAYFGSNVASYFLFVRTLIYINVFMMIILISFVVIPEGDLSNSIMYYGLYTDDLDLSYHLPLAYFLTWLCANLFCFVAIISIMIMRYRKSKLSDDRNDEYKFAWKLFCTWDHSITSRHGVIDFRTSYRTEMKRYMGRILSNIFVIGVLVGSGYLIYKVASDSTWSLCQDSCKDTIFNGFLERYQLTFVVAGLKFIVPPIFQEIVVVEGWHPRVETKLTLARTTVFYIASILTFVYSLLEVTDDCTIPEQNVTMNHINASDELCCWENEVGEEILKVILVDLGILFATTIFFHMHRALWVKCTCKMIGYSKFNVVSCVLDVIYGQCLIWLGLYFSPLLAGIGVVKLVIVFYLRYIVAKVAMVPPQQLFRASSTGNFYLAVLLLNFFICIFPMAYAIIELKPSTDCGPFSGRDYSYYVISDLIGDKVESALEEEFNFIGTPAVLVPILTLLIMFVVYFKVKSSSYKVQISELRKQLKFERKVEKRKIFATGRAMSGGAYGRYTSNDSLASTPVTRHRKLSQQTDLTILEEEVEKSV
ncbi:Transmembrane channel-like [Mactra antiquata]